MTTPDNQSKSDEQQRLFIALGIVATVVAAFTIPLTGNAIWTFARGAGSIPAAFAFLYIILTGSHLRYTNNGTLGDFEVPQKYRHFCYDISIDSFWTVSYIAIFVSVFTIVNGGNNNPLQPSFILGIITSCMVTFGIFGLSLRPRKKALPGSQNEAEK